MTKDEARQMFMAGWSGRAAAGVPNNPSRSFETVWEMYEQDQS